MCGGIVFIKMVNGVRNHTFFIAVIACFLLLYRNMVLAERCALLSAEILKSQGKYSEAATLLIKMTSEDSDLRSALLLEQAAHCFINMRNPMVRKFAFHMILAGHRFSKAEQ
ncbi:Trafficking protein particle complex 8, partial [Xenoophorus captivus]